MLKVRFKIQDLVIEQTINLLRVRLEARLDLFACPQLMVLSFEERNPLLKRVDGLVIAGADALDLELMARLQTDGNIRVRLILLA